MADMKQKLLPYFDELKPLFKNLSWYGEKNSLSGVDDDSAILTYTTEKSNADAQVHYWRVTLALYVNNNVGVSLDLSEYGYEQVAETAIDDHRNPYTAYNRQVLVL